MWSLNDMPERLDQLAEDQVLTLQDAAPLLGLEPLTLEYLANRKAYGLKSKVVKAKRTFIVRDLRAFLLARQQSGLTAQ